MLTSLPTAVSGNSLETARSLNSLPRLVINHPHTVADGWKVYQSDRPIRRYATKAECIAAIEKAAKRYPKQRDFAYPDDRILAYGTYLYWMWRDEWQQDYPFPRCMEIGVASLAEGRRKTRSTLCPGEAHLFELFGHAANAGTKCRRSRCRKLGTTKE